MLLKRAHPMNTSHPASGVLARARRLGAGVVLAGAVAQTAIAATLSLDYMGVGKYSNSGFFKSGLDSSKADGEIIPGGFKLSGSETITDSIFWRWDSIDQRTVPGFDTTGIAFVWGGTINGATTSYDSIGAPFDFLLDFTNNISDPYANVNVEISVGVRNQQYVPQDWGGSGPGSSAWASNTQWFSFSEAGSYHQTGNMSVNLWETTDQLYWYAFAAVHWNNEFVSSRNWNGSYSKLSGDSLTFTIPTNSIDVAYVPGQRPPDNNPPNPTVPDGGSTAGLLGVAALMGFLLRGRKR